MVSNGPDFEQRVSWTRALNAKLNPHLTLFSITVQTLFCFLVVFPQKSGYCKGLSRSKRVCLKQVSCFTTIYVVKWWHALETSVMPHVSSACHHFTTYIVVKHDTCFKHTRFDLEGPNANIAFHEKKGRNSIFPDKYVSFLLLLSAKIQVYLKKYFSFSLRHGMPL